MVDVDVSVHQSLFLPSKGRERLPQFPLFVTKKRQFFLHRVILQDRIKRCRAELFSNLDGAPDAQRLHAQRKQAFEQVVDGDVRFRRCQQRPASFLCKSMQQVRRRGGFSRSGGALNQRQTTGHGG